MGYVTDMQGRLCCEICGKAGGVRRHRCPFNYCGPDAVCPECRKLHREKFNKASHVARGCERSHLRFRAEQAEKARLKSLGIGVLCSALHSNACKPRGPADTVLAIFESDLGTSAYYIPDAIYSTIKSANPTAQTYEAAALAAGFPKLQSAPCSFFGETT